MPYYDQNQYASGGSSNKYNSSQPNNQSQHPYRQPPSQNNYTGSYQEGVPRTSHSQRSAGRFGEDMSRRGFPAATGAAAAHNMVTPGADNYSDSASGGMAGIAYSVAERNARESGMQAARQPPPPAAPRQAYGQQGRDPFATETDSYSSLNSIGTPARGTPTRGSGRNSPHGPHAPMAVAYGEPVGYGAYRDDPYGGLSRTSQPDLGIVNPNEIIDDGDDGIGPTARARRKSWLSQHSSRGAAGLGAVGAGAAATGASRAAGDGSGAYGPVGTNSASAGATGGLGGEKSEWLDEHHSSRGKAIKWAIIVVVVAGIIGAVIGTLYGTGVFGGKGGAKGGKSGGQSADDDMRQNGDLNIDSAEIKALLNNPDLHKVFPGVDYTPINTQYPDCLKSPPSQNNVTRDLAVISQLTNEVRLYGTDCNQTQMAVHAIRQLKLEDTMRIWIGVWQDNNSTTNARQLEQMWDILDTYGDGPFAGLIVANEILFRREMTASELGSLISDVRQNLTDKNLNIEVSTSDLGDDWDSSINSTSHSVMANIHPFFAGIPAQKAADWTWNFWSGTDGRWWRSDNDTNIIAETGWPTKGGTSCGSATVTDCGDNGSVASIDGLNAFMESWVCKALDKGTRYFWFTAFDEPWKIRFNEDGRAWEDQWGLLDVNRNLKDGVKIPDCGGKTPKSYFK